MKNFSTLCKPASETEEWNPQASAVHKYTPKMVQHGPTFTWYWKNIFLPGLEEFGISFNTQVHIHAYNGGKFDVPFII